MIHYEITLVAAWVWDMRGGCGRRARDEEVPGLVILGHPNAELARRPRRLDAALTHSTSRMNV